MRYGPWTITEADGELHASVYLSTGAPIESVEMALCDGRIDGYTRLGWMDDPTRIQHTIHTNGDDLQRIVAAIIFINTEQTT